MENFLKTSDDLFIVKFNTTSNGFVFTGSTSGVLGDLIERLGSGGIDKICRYNGAKMKFERISKELVKQLFSFDTYTIEQLKRVNFISK